MLWMHRGTTNMYESVEGIQVRRVQLGKPYFFLDKESTPLRVITQKN